MSGKLTQLFVSTSSPPIYSSVSLEQIADYRKGGDIGRPRSCCSNEEWCFISNITDTNNTDSASCCQKHNTCAKETPCSPDEFLVISTITLTVVASSQSDSSRNPSITQAPEVSIASSCQLRPCETNHFQCPSSLGAGCCGVGLSCMPNNQCGSYVPEATTVATINDPNCSVGFYTCEDEEKGCCQNGAVCTVVTGEGKCASASASATGVRNPGNFTEVAADPSGPLSGGAKAGIGVGVTLGALFIIFITFCCIRRRNRRRELACSETASTALQDGVPMTTTEAHSSPGVSGAPGRGGWRGRRGEGGNIDYFGPRATAGPYTGDADATPGPGDEVSPGQWPRGAVPVSPDGPGDIVPAVEIGGTERRPALGREGDGSGQGSDIATARLGHGRQKSRQLEDMGVDAAGVEPAPSYVDSTSGVGVDANTWTREQSTVEFAQGSRATHNTLQGDNKDAPEHPTYRHELP